MQVEQETPNIIMQHAFYGKNDSLFLILRFEDVREVLDVLQAASSYEYTVRNGVGAQSTVVTSDSLDLPVRSITDVEGEVTVRMALPGSVVQEPNVLQLILWNVLSGQERMGVKFKLPLTQQMLRKNYLLEHAKTGKPLFQNYVTTADKLVVKSFGGGTDPVNVQRFAADFGPALPPMAVEKGEVPRTLSAIDTKSFYPGDTIRFEEQGLYLFEPNTAFTRGLLVLPNHYPQITKTEEMLQPLIYLTTSEEREALLREADTKAAVDKFWIATGGDKNVARDLIRKFYSRVEMANKLFSSHKAGWATDRGMIYIIYGEPTNVSQVGSNITWIYRNRETAPYTKFVFTKKENTFTENHYELVRRRDYEDSWYSSVAKWRAGKINM